MKPIVFPFALAVSAACCSPAIAQRQTAVGPGSIPLSPTGVLNGVDMSASATTGTLTVGVPGGAKTDIFTLNNALVPGSLAVSTAASSQGNIVFNSSSTVFGGIGVTQPGGPFLLDISGGNDGTAVDLLGPLYATRLNVTGTGTVNFNSGSTNITATNFAGDGTITLAPNTTVIGALTNTAGANTGTLALGGGSVLDGAVGGATGLRAINVVGGSDAAGVTARITGAANAYSFSLGTNTLNVGGALTIANTGPGGVIHTTLASPTVYGNIRAVGATNLGPTLRVNVNVPSTAFIPVGTIFNIVQTEAGTVQSGTDGSVVSVTAQNPTNPLYTFAAEPLAGTIAGQVAIRTVSIPLLVPLQPPPEVVVPVTPIAVVVVPVLVTIAPTPPVVAPVIVASPVVPSPVVPLPTTTVTPPTVTPTVTAAPVAVVSPTSDLITNVLPAINAFSEPVPVINAIAQLAPSVSGLAAPLLTFQGGRQFQSLWHARLDEVMCDQTRQPNEDMQICGVEQRKAGWWLKGFGYFGQQDAQDAFVGYDSRVVGTMLAYDAPIGTDTRVGVGIGYARSMIDGHAVGSGTSDTDFDTYKATAYIGHESGPWFIYGDASFGWSEYTGKRNISFTGINRTAEATYSGQDYTAHMTTGYHFFVEGFTVTPLAALQYTHVNLSGYTETGAGDINLKVDSQSYDFLESTLGVKVAHAFGYDGGTYVPEIHVKWLRELTNPTITNTAAFTVGSPKFTTPGMKTAADTFNVGTGLTLLSCSCTAKTWSLEAVYDYHWREDGYDAHQAQVRFAARF